MKKFNANPISFKYNGKVTNIKELKYDISKLFLLEIIDCKDNSVLFEKQLITETLLPIVNLENSTKVLINYYDYKTNILKDSEYFYVKIIDNFYSNVKRYVCANIDYLEFEKDKKYHLNMIKECNHNPIARSYLENRIRNLILNKYDLPIDAVGKYTFKIYSEVYGLGIIQALDDDKNIGEIIVNVLKKDNHEFSSKIYYMKDQIKYKYDKSFNNLQEVLTVFRRILSGTGKELNEQKKSKIETTRYNKDRITITIPYFTLNYSLNLRRFEDFIPNEETMIKKGTLNQELIELFKLFVESELNIGIGGKMGYGKSSLINYMLTLIPDKDERVSVICSIDETDIWRTLKDNDILLYMVDDSKGFTFEDAFEKALRSTSNRIIVPEARGKEMKLINKACIQLAGNIFTGHARTDEGFLDACVDMYNADNNYQNLKALKDKIAKDLGIVIIMGKAGNRLVIKTVSEVCFKENHFTGFNVLYKWVKNNESPQEGYYTKVNDFTDNLKELMNENGVSLSRINSWFKNCD